MNYRKTMLASSALALAVGLSTTAARADLLADVVAELTSNGYTVTETKVGLTRSKVEATKDGTKREITIDRLSGRVAKDESGPDDGSDDGADDGSGGNSGPGGSGGDSGSGGNSGPGGSGGNSGGGSGGDSGGGSGGGGMSALSPAFDYLNGGIDMDIDFV